MASPGGRETDDAAAAFPDERATSNAVASRCSAPCGALHADRPWRRGRKFLSRSLGGPTTSSAPCPLKLLRAERRGASLRLLTDSTDNAAGQYRMSSPRRRPVFRRRAPLDQDPHKYGKTRKTQKTPGTRPETWTTRERACQVMTKCRAVNPGSSWRCGRVYTNPRQEQTTRRSGKRTKINFSRPAVTQNEVCLTPQTEGLLR